MVKGGGLADYSVKASWHKLPHNKQQGNASTQQLPRRSSSRSSSMISLT